MSADRVPPTRAVIPLRSGNDPPQDLLAEWLSLSGEGRRLKFADTARAADVAGVARRTVLDWIEMGHIATVRIGKKHWICLDSLNRYLKARQDSLE